MIILRQKEYAFMPGLVNAVKTSLTPSSIKYNIIKNASNNAKIANNLMSNPGQAINRGVASVIRHPAKTITEGASFATKKVIDNSLPNLAGGTIGVTDLIPSTGLSSKLGNSIQSVIDGGKKSAPFLRSLKADRYLKSNTAGKVEYGVNSVMMGLSKFSQNLGL